MKARSMVGIAGVTLRAVSVAAALACAAGGVLAGTASVNITSFTVNVAEFSGNFAFAMDPYQSFGMTALEAGGLFGAGSDNFTANNWNQGLNRIAHTPNATATGNTIQFTDATTQLATGGFNVSAQAIGAYSPPNQPNSASAGALQSGTFVLLDENGAFTAGTLTFDVFYDMSVSTPGSSATNYSQTTLNLLSSSDTGGSASFADGLVSNALAGGTGSVTSGHYTWSYTLGAGEAAYYTLSGSAVAFAALPVTAIPEPETYALMMLGLAGLGVMARRRRPGAAADTVAA